MKEASAIYLASQEAVAPDPDSDLSMISLEYHEFADLFSKQVADKLPVHQFYDYMTPLEPGKVLPFSLICKLSLMELEVV